MAEALIRYSLPGNGDGDSILCDGLSCAYIDEVSRQLARCFARQRLYARLDLMKKLVHIFSVLMLHFVSASILRAQPATFPSGSLPAAENTPTPASSAFTYGGVFCGGTLTTPKDGKNDVSITSFPSDQIQRCNEMFAVGRGMAQAAGWRKQGYDTLKAFVEKCAPDTNFRGTQQAFTGMNGAIQYMGGEMTRYLEYREWLKSVLYLNTVDPGYYCAAVEAIMFTYMRDGTYTHNFPAQLAILQYLLESGKCDKDILLQYYKETRDMQRKTWADTTTVDTNLVKMDTTLPTLEDLDLEILRGPQQGSVPSETYASPALLEVRATTNPFTSSTEIEYTLGRTAQVEISVYNALGQAIWSQPFGAVRDARTHHISIGSDLQPGTYFLRVATLTGDVRTLKLVKQ